MTRKKTNVAVRSDPGSTSAWAIGCAFLVVGAALLSAAAAPPAAAQTASASGAAKHAVADLAWLAGSWQGEHAGGAMEEHWTAPSGGSMLATSRVVSGGKTVSFEFLRIQEEKDGIVLTAMPNGKPGVPFRLTALRGSEAVFENPKHDFPTRIIYRLGTDGSLFARIEGIEAGKPKGEDYRFRRMK